MRKGILILLSLLACLASCSDSSDSTDIVGKQYVFKNDTLTVSVSFLGNNSATMQAFNRGVVCFSNVVSAYYSGEYPSIVFECHESNIYQFPKQSDSYLFTMNCQFAAVSSFDATVTSNDLRTIYEDKPFQLPTRMHFTEYAGTLDVNGDGLLDEMFAP
ncbi:MAG: hypothetical protein IJ604_08935 [Prevotella sp.]|nr:hypothetical protein [Prevotella sp.]